MIRSNKTPSPLVHNYSDLEQYVRFLRLIEEAKATGQRQPLTWAIQEAVHRNILKDYLERKGGEVSSILMTEYDYATNIAVKQEEGISIGLATGREEGISIGLERGAYENKLKTAKSLLVEGVHPEMVARCTGLPMEIVLKLTQE